MVQVWQWLQWTLLNFSGDPANFLDVGGTANATRVEQAFLLF